MSQEEFQRQTSLMDQSIWTGYSAEGEWACHGVWEEPWRGGGANHDTDDHQETCPGFTMSDEERKWLSAWLIGEGWVKND